jgi:predicted transcriptional regulator
VLSAVPGFREPFAESIHTIAEHLKLTSQEVRVYLRIFLSSKYVQMHGNDNWSRTPEGDRALRGDR